MTTREQIASTLKGRVFLLMDRPDGSKYNRMFNTALMTLIILNVVAVILETVQSIYDAYETAFFIFDTFSIVVFSIEYILRLWTCTAVERFKGRYVGRLKYIFTPMAIVDLIAILPSLVPLFIDMDLRVLRAMRLFRLVRLLKLARYSLAIRTLVKVGREKKPELIVVFSFGLVLITASASIMYFAEHDAQPEKFSSIPRTMWWAVATLTTVGYGDVYPITNLGRFLGAVIACIGVGLFALPAAILSSGFTSIKDLENEDQTKSGEDEICPTCGAKRTPQKKLDKVA